MRSLPEWVRSYPDRLVQRPVWGMAFLLLVVLLGLAEFIQYPGFVRETIDALPATASSADREQLRMFLMNDLLSQLGILPVRRFIPLIIMSWLLAVVCNAFGSGKQRSARHYLALLVRAEYILAFHTLLSSLLFLCGIDVMSLHPIHTSVPAGWAVPLSLFSLLYVLILGEGVHRVASMGRPAATGIAAGLWLVSTGTGMAINRMIGAGFGFSG